MMRKQFLSKTYINSLMTCSVCRKIIPLMFRSLYAKHPLTVQRNEQRTNRLYILNSIYCGIIASLFNCTLCSLFKFLRKL